MKMEEQYKRIHYLFGLIAVIITVVEGQVADDEPPPYCGGRVTNFTGNLITPTMPGRKFYYPLQKCSWDIPRKRGYRIMLEIVKFDLEEQSFTGKCEDYASFNFDRVCGHLPKGKTFGPFHQGVAVQFISSPSRVAEGFNIAFRHEKIPVCEPPCDNGGTCTRDNECVCARGFAGYRCKYADVHRSNTINKGAVGNVLPRDTCVIYGQKNVRTFDGKMFNIPTSCEYALMEFQDAKVSVSMKDPKDRGLTAIKKVTVSRGVQSVIVSSDATGKLSARDSRGRLLKVPNFYGPFELMEPYQKVRVKDEDFIVDVDADGSSVRICTLKTLQKGSVRGLCGNFNGNVTDDMMSASGNMVKDDEMLALAWNQDISCVASTADIPREGRWRDAGSICNNLRTPPFSACLNKLPVAQYYAACLNDMRLCEFESRPDCYCASITQYARDCARAKISTELIWRKGLCQKKCPGNQIFSECAPYCAKTCKSLGTVARCKDECVDGCTCAGDTYWDGISCVEKEDCPCHVGEVQYAKNEKFEEKCRKCECINGTLECTSKQCEGTALVFGNPYFLTFDGLWYTFDGTCSYTLMRGPAPEFVRMIINPKKCGTESASTCIDNIIISSEVTPTVKLLAHGSVTVDDQNVDLPYFKKDRLEIYALTSSYIIVHLVAPNIRVKWNDEGIAVIYVPHSFQGKLGGLLGNFNGKTADEFLSPSGIVENTPSLFAETWEARTQCDRPEIVDGRSCKLLDEDRKLCHQGVYNQPAFQTCIAVSCDEEPIKGMCQEQACSSLGNDKQKEICKTLSVFAMLCAFKGHVAHWRNDTYCNISCTNGKVYDPWGTSCGRTCRGLTSNETCTDFTPRAEGCVCPNGKYENKDGKCVDRSYCACYYGGEWRDNGAFFIYNQRDCDCVRGIVSCSAEKNIKCGTELQYKDCAQGSSGANCQPTCGNKKPVCAGECISGCGCPKGQYMHGGKCFHEKDCPCTFEGKDFSHNERVIDDCDQCTCNRGEWNCKRTNLCTRACSLTSGSYFKTFDDSRFHSRGTCKYVLMTDKCKDSPDRINYFEIYAQSHPCKDTGYKMCNLTIHARFGNDAFVLARGHDIMEQFSGINNRYFYHISSRKLKVGFYQVVEADFYSFYIQLRYDMKTSLTIEVSKNISIQHSRYGRQLCGLCGNMDGSSANDFITKAGYSDPISFINEWRKEDCAELPKEEISSCMGKPVQADNAKRQCRIILGPLFKACHNKINPKPFYDTCIEETCTCETGGQCECYCSSVSAYAEACGRRGAKVNWRLATGCPVECREFTSPDADLCDVKYDPCKPCVKTCCSRCALGCFEGCFPSCKEGLVFNPLNQTCIPEEHCICPKAPTYIVPTRPPTSSASTLSELFTTTATTTEGTTVPGERPKPAMCPPYCRTNVGKPKHYGETWLEGCLNLTCVRGDDNCPNVTKKVEECTDPPVCQENETRVLIKTDECDCEQFKCECNKCIYEGKTYNLTETWQQGDCVTMVCDIKSCPDAVQETDRRNFCPQTAANVSCPKYNKETQDNSDPCCPKSKCVCDRNSCPKEPSCVAGVRVDDDRSNECCTVHKCQPTCVYNGKQYKNGTRVSQSRCFEEFCRCDDETCSVNKENEVICSGTSTKPCINDNTEHFGSISTQGGCCTTYRCNCECRVYGDPHYDTFDGKNYTFPGVCPYTLVKYRDSDNLHIIGDNERCSPEEKPGSCLKRVIIHWKKIKIVLSADGDIEINGKKVSKKSLPRRISRYVRLSARRSGEILLRIKPISLMLYFQVIGGTANLNIKVPMSKLYNNTVGLCGTCSNDLGDDFETSSGNLTEDSDEFGYSWQSNKTQKNCQPCRNSKDINCLTCDEIKKTMNETALPERCWRCPENDPCAHLRDDIFNKTCTIKPERFERNCYSDQDKARQCSVCNSSSFIQYAENCGKCVKWRTTFNCTPECPHGQIYKDCVSECDLGRTCENRNAPGSCETEDASGCGCPDGMVFLNADKEKCVEEKCCECPEPKCKEYEILVTLPNQNPDNCCAEKVCQCKELVHNITCTAPKKPHITDKDTPGCNHTVCECPTVPECPVVTKNCNSLGCTQSEEVGDCGCTTKIECKCSKAMCPPLPKCEKCHLLNVSYPDEDTSQPCGGICCPIGKCQPIQCPQDFPHPKSYSECPFLKDRGTTFESDDKDKCCPKSFEPVCFKEKCDVLKTVKDCPKGYVLQAKKVAESSDPGVSRYSSCSNVDECCQYKECVCSSCLDGSGRLELGKDRFEDNGCKRISCKVGKRNDEGCYNVTLQTPTCPKPPSCECYQSLRETPAPRGAEKVDDWLSLCCPNYTCEDLPCPTGYTSGPDACAFPSERTVDYLNIEECLYPKCPKASCECNYCLDSDGRAHNIGTVMPGKDKCENHTCIKDDQSECPKFKISREECVPLACNDEYEKLKSEQSPAMCCPQQKCICKPEDMLKEICEGYKNDTSTCSDPQNMMLNQTHKYYEHKCCPEKECVCKPESQLECGSKKSCGENFDLVKTSNASETKCCAEYECVCNCEKKSCKYKSWIVKNGHDGCKCECVCDQTLCDSRKPSCQEGEHVIVARRKDDGCCPVYECKCNTSACSPIPSANCTEYQIEYPWKKSKDDCCPTKNKCKCNPNSEKLQQLCNETRGVMPHNCSEGWEPYVASVMASADDTMCCDTQCRCVSCQTTNGTVVEIGTAWEETKDCKIVQSRCSEKLLTNGCHKIITNERDVPCDYKSLGDYEEKHCKSNSYAVQVMPQEGCCPSYECVDCPTTDWSCTSYAEVRVANSTNHRCPGECICANPLKEEQSKWCLKEAKCGEFELAAPLNALESGISHKDKCCPPYKCVCGECPSSVVTQESLNPRPEYCEIAGVRPSDYDKKCCKNYKIQCNKNCSCKDMNSNCTREESACLQTTTTTNICNCPVQVNCVCHEKLCPTVKCDDCEVLSTDNVDPDSSLPCNGNCCPKQKCIKKPCLKINDPVIPSECTFLKKVDTFKSDKCCPVSKDIQCKNDKSSCPYNALEKCDPGYELETVHANESHDLSVQAVKHCPMVDLCCPHKVCVCKSCVYEGGRLNLGDRPVLSSDGCTKYTCNQQFQREDGCYNASTQRPECPPPPMKECYQSFDVQDPVLGATREDQWDDLCCRHHVVKNNTCSKQYKPGPDECLPPAVREITYETIGECKNPDCPIAKCKCTECLDWKNMTHTIGSEYTGENECDTFTCLEDSTVVCQVALHMRQLCSERRLSRSKCLRRNCCYEGSRPFNLSCFKKKRIEIGNVCPRSVKKELLCPKPRCDDTYQVMKQNDVDGECCPNRTCECKSDEMLKEVCDDYRNDTSNCTEPENMVLKFSGKFTVHQCCPQMDCVCKEKNQRICQTKKCIGKFNKLVKKKDASDTKCCDEYACECDCSEKRCAYESWTPKSDSMCSCTCECDKTKCSAEKPICSEGEDVVQIGNRDGGCCPVYECVCNNTNCPALASANCSIFQMEYDWRDGVSKCCPVQKRCKCNPNSDELKRLCNESSRSLSEGCKAGYEPYIAKVMANSKAGLCCDAQCRCISCTTEDGQIKEVGSAWSENKNCRKLSHRCSDQLLENGCHKIVTTSENIPCLHSSIEAFENINCGESQYAVGNYTDACCPDYSCVPCKTQSWDCESPNEVRQPDTSNSRCPGNCTCVAPMVKKNKKACLATAACGTYEKSILLGEGEHGIKHPDHCCPNYKCICDTCPNGTVTRDQVPVKLHSCEVVSVRASDTGRECCRNFEVSCNVSCSCPTQEDTLFAPKCTHLKHKLDYQNDTCCPAKEIVCKKTTSCPYHVRETCSEGHTMETTPVSMSPDGSVSNFIDCPMIDECCPYRTCVCNSCKYPNGTMNAGDKPVFSPDGCVKYTCTRGLRSTDGCYKVTMTRPECQPPPLLACYQRLNNSDAHSNAGNETEWAHQCCPHYSIEDKSCGEDYNAGPSSCAFPAVMEEAYKTVDGCKYENCPIRKCVCLQCVDANNKTHDIGTTYNGANDCDSVTCVAAMAETCSISNADRKRCGWSRISPKKCRKRQCCYNNGKCYRRAQRKVGEVCPKPEKKTPDCPVLLCNEKYETMEEAAVEGECCPNRTCICKTEEMLKEVCDEFENDTSHCSDPANMEMVVTGSQPAHSCCPLKECRCKDLESRNCTFSNDYVCPANYTTVLKMPVSTTNCCPKFRCDCNCSALTCNEVQIARSSASECNCRCECDYSKCPLKPTCGPNEVLRKVGTIFDGCCSKYQCYCNTSSCLSKPVTCNGYQERYMVTQDGCCEEEYCRCKNSSAMLEKGCSSADCAPGYKKSYRDPDSKCCGYCTCSSCVTKEGNFTPGESWNVTEDYCTATKICSEKKGSDGCHEAEIVHNDNDTCLTADEYRKSCNEVEEPVVSVHLSQNSCCDQYQCKCSKNVTKLRDGCSEYDGTNCSEFKQSSFVDVKNCCPVYECECKECTYSCPYGHSVNKSDNVNSTTDGCCYEYTCECDQCFIENRKPLTVGEIWVEKIQHRCFKNHTCVKDDNVCKTVVEDPSKNCSSLKEYEMTYCEVPYQKALATAQRDPNNPCCIQHQCVCNDTNECPNPDSPCMKSQRRVIDGKMDDTGNCCDNYTCVCREKKKLDEICDYTDDYRCSENGYVRAKINSSDPCCPNYTCSCNPDTCEKPKTKCAIGMRLIKEPTTGCCPNYTCQCSHCVSQALEHKPGTSWSEDSCSTISCVNTTTCPRVESTPTYNCTTSFDEEDCKKRGGIVRGSDASKGCCKECISSQCKRIEKRMVISRNISGVLCESAEKIEVGDCVGACPSIISHHPLTGNIQAQCGCCTPNVGNTTQMLVCENGSFESVYVQAIRSCECAGH